MPAATLHLYTTAPLFLNAFHDRTELRPASVRGEIRYWLRALLGAQHADIAAVWLDESAVMGSTASGSPITLRILTQPTSEDFAQFPLLPHRESNRSQACAIKCQVAFPLSLSVRPGMLVPDRFWQALSVWLLLGGLGKRSRRMFGGLAVHQIESTSQPPLLIPPAWQPLAQPIASPAALSAHITALLTSIIGNTPATLPAMPDFPTLHPRHSVILVGTKPFDNSEAANRTLFEILRSSIFRPHERVFGYATNGRRASPLIAQVRQIGTQFYPILTVMRSPLDVSVRNPWKIMNDFIMEATDKFGGITAWGGPLA